MVDHNVGKPFSECLAQLESPGNHMLDIQTRQRLRYEVHRLAFPEGSDVSVVALILPSE